MQKFKVGDKVFMSIDHPDHRRIATVIDVADVGRLDDIVLIEFKEHVFGRKIHNMFARYLILYKRGLSNFKKTNMPEWF